ncbi:MAG: TSUP family transporter [Promethearchaeota archaeon]
MSEISFLIVILIIAALLNFLDGSLGMGYGTTLTIILFVLGYEPEQVVLPILVSGLIAGSLASLFHLLLKNVSLSSEKHFKIFSIDMADVPAGIGNDIRISIESRKLSLDTKIILVFTVFGVISAVIGAFFSTALYKFPLSAFIIKLYIGILVLVLGLILLLMKDKTMKFSFKKIVTLGLIAGFNKSVSGGGFGPIAVSGQMIAGREGKNAIASTSLSEAIISITGIVIYFLTDFILGGAIIDYTLIPFLTVGACITAPFASFATKKIDKDRFKKYIAIGLIILSVIIILKTIFF